MHRNTVFRVAVPTLSNCTQSNRRSQGLYTPLGPRPSDEIEKHDHADDDQDQGRDEVAVLL